MLNTQPGIFLLYNLHAQSLKDVQDRLEMVFGLPAASMFSTDRYSFLKKVRFGRKARVYRMLGTEYETDLKEHKFVQIFSMDRGQDIDSTTLKCLFLDMPEAEAKSLSNVDLGKIAKGLKISFVPPALERRCDETGIPPDQYIIEAFFKGKLYSQIAEAAAKYDHPHFLELDFVLEATTAANNLLKSLHAKEGEIDWQAVESGWQKTFSAMVKNELEESAADAVETGNKIVSGEETAAQDTRRENLSVQAPRTATESERDESAKKRMRLRKTTEIGNSKTKGE
jgi:hypothetical protein